MPPRTPSARYTGAHKHRFDEEGRGRGLAGRDFVGKGGGSGTARVDSSHGFVGDTNTKTDTVFHDSSQFLMR